MTPKEKAKELVEKFRKHSNGFNTIGTHDGGDYRSKKCALIAVDELINHSTILKSYWQKVKEEINNL